MYDKSIPSAEAVELFDDFLVRLSTRNLKVFVISGNHDSAERIAFGGRLMDKSGIYMSPVYNGSVTPITVNDQFGEVNIYMLPFVKPANVRRFFPDKEITSYTDALKTAVDAMNVDTAKRNLLITHQFVTGATRSDSDEVSVGGSDNVDASVFGDFDYVALGHIHKPQRIGVHPVWYAGSPLKYSFGESGQTKRVLFFDMDETGLSEIEEAELCPMREMRKLTGSLRELMENPTFREIYREDYIQAVLTDKGELIDPMGTLRSAYPNMMQIVRQEALQKNMSIGAEAAGRRSMAEKKDTFALFTAFYREVRGEELGEEGKQIIRELIKETEV